MELKEASLGNLIDDFAHDENTCYTCQKKKAPDDLENIFSDAHDEDKEEDDDYAADTIGIRFKNDASKLGKALEGANAHQPRNYKALILSKAKGKDRTMTMWDITTAAHHLIPGNAALSKSLLFSEGKYLRTKGMAPGNIGYNINKAANGVWLPGNYAIRPWGPDGTTFEKNELASPKEYVHSAVEKLGHFHDSHSKYSLFVENKLNKLNEKLEETPFNCPQATDEATKEKTALCALVGRLDSISDDLRGMLTAQGPVGMKKCWRRNVYTSSWMPGYWAAIPEPGP